MVMRAQLAAPNLKLITPEIYNQMFTMHGTTMIFLVAMPVLTGFGVYLVPLMIGANEMALPRLGALSFWLQLFGGVLLYISFATGSAPAAGWFSYAPLSEKAFSRGRWRGLLGARVAADYRRCRWIGNQLDCHGAN